jgi:Arc/MetJ-type ribon-helix-helix transcriptional regulator
MTIHLPKDVERSIEAAVHDGRFASADAALAAAWRAFVGHGVPPTAAAADDSAADPLLGSMANHADLMDEIVEQAMRNREHQPWRLTTGE